MFLDILKAIILGIAEGVTEFLPISSTGHLILVNQFISFSDPFTKVFDIVIQLGAILAVVFYFWKRLWPFVNNIKERHATLQVWYRVLIGVIPALILGALLGDFIEDVLFDWKIVVAALVIGGVALVLIENRNREARINSITDISFSTAFGIGLIQTLALIPGTSRAAATIIGAMLLGASRFVAVEFSFFLAIPTMIAASAYSFFKHGFVFEVSEYITLAVGFIVSFFTALAVVKFLLRYVQAHNFKAFGYYRIALGIIVFLVFLVL